MSEQNINDLLSGGGFSSLLQNPDIAAKLPRIMEALKPVMEEMRAEQGGKPSAEASTAASADSSDSAPASANPLAALSVVGGGGGGGGGKQRTSSARRCALLKALEPYLSDNRREAMEYIIKVSSLIDILSEVM
ncbi:MAG: hypothetical protein IJX64_07630 [Clostridia bacterium]|nr:hypothetical protein [Clostridia bacterium]